jgi:outer membrane protein, multidrug efflux system
MAKKSTTKGRIGRGLRWSAILVLTGCAVGPDYHRPAPEVVVPPAWGWKMATPRDSDIKGDWWKMFQDPTLDQLEAEATGANQDVKGALARIDQARAVARVSAAEFSPQITLAPSAIRLRTPPTAVPPDFTANILTAPLDLSYEIDLWGRVRRSFEAARAQAQASVADYANILLGVNGDVATDYFLLRQLDAQTLLLQQTVALREKAVKITGDRFHAGISPELDFNRAKTELAQTKIDLTETSRQRDDLQDALALLCGQLSVSFRIPPGPASALIPPVPLGLPSDLLERRPDVAEAERKMAAANAQIGVAYAAFFPAISLTGEAGYSSFQASTLLNWQSRFFQIGPELSLPLLNGGRTESEVKEARAAYLNSCAFYQQQVLTAFRDVSDAANDLHGYGVEALSESDALASSAKTLDLDQRSYNNGLVNYLDVVDAQRTDLQIQLQQAQILAQRQMATVHLIKALGGGFDMRR